MVVCEELFAKVSKIPSNPTKTAGVMSTKSLRTLVISSVWNSVVLQWMVLLMFLFMAIYNLFMVSRHFRCKMNGCRLQTMA